MQELTHPVRVAKYYAVAFCAYILVLEADLKMQTGKVSKTEKNMWYKVYAFKIMFFSCSVVVHNMTTCRSWLLKKLNEMDNTEIINNVECICNSTSL